MSHVLRDYRYLYRLLSKIKFKFIIPEMRIIFANELFFFYLKFEKSGCALYSRKQGYERFDISSKS